MKTSLKTVLLLAIPCIMIIGAVGVVSSQNTNKKVILTNQTSSSSSQNSSANSSTTTEQILTKLSKITSVPNNQTPVIAQVGDKKNLATAQELRLGNSIDAQIYKDARNGDYVFGFEKQLIVYRLSEEKIIYDGKSADLLLKDSEAKVISLIVSQAKKIQLVPTEYDLKPQVSVVTDPNTVKKINSFYNSVEKDDFIAQFSEPNIVVIYRPSTDTIINNGTFDLQINSTK